jgi:hypothetical protein
MDIHVCYLDTLGRNMSNKETRIKNMCKKERKKKRKEDIYDENRTV